MLLTCSILLLLLLLCLFNYISYYYCFRFAYWKLISILPEINYLTICFI